MWGDYSPTPDGTQVGMQIEVDNAPEMAVTASQVAVSSSMTTEAMIASLGKVPGFSNDASTAVEGDVGGARTQS